MGIIAFIKRNTKWLLLLAFSSCAVFDYKIYMENRKMEEFQYDALVPPKKHIDFLIKELQFNYANTKIITNIYLPETENKQAYKFPNDREIKTEFVTTLQELLTYSNIVDILNIENETDWGVLTLNDLFFEIYIKESNYFFSDGFSGLKLTADLNAYCSPQVVTLKETFPLNLKAKEQVTFLIRYKNEYDDFIDAISEKIFYITYELSQQLTSELWPHWNSETRFYYAYGDKYMKRASRCLEKDNWPEAIEIWKQASQTDHPATKKHGLYNLITGYEIINEVDSAIITAEKYSETYNAQHTNNYINRLKKRKQETIQLNNLFKNNMEEN